VLLLTNKDISLLTRRKLYTSSVRSCMLHGSETWPVKKEKELTVQWSEMRMTDSKLRDRLGTDDIITVIQWHKLRRWHGHVL